MLSSYPYGIKFVMVFYLEKTKSKINKVYSYAKNNFGHNIQ